MLHLGNEKLAAFEDIIGIFDIDATTTTANTREFLNKAQKNDEIISLSDDIPRAFIVADNNADDFDVPRETSVYLTNISAQTLYKRINNWMVE